MSACTRGRSPKAADKCAAALIYAEKRAMHLHELTDDPRFTFPAFNAASHIQVSAALSGLGSSVETRVRDWRPQKLGAAAAVSAPAAAPTASRLASRKTDAVGRHGKVVAGAILGGAIASVIGLAIFGAVVVATAGLAAPLMIPLVVGAGLGAIGLAARGVSVGAKVGATFPMSPCSKCTSGSGDVGRGSPVMIEGQPVARLGVDRNGHGKTSKPKQGCKTVYVNGKPLARLDDSLDCGGKFVSSAQRTWVDPKTVTVASEGSSSEETIVKWADTIADTANGLAAAISIGPLLYVVGPVVVATAIASGYVLGTAGGAGGRAAGKAIDERNHTPGRWENVGDFAGTTAGMLAGGYLGKPGGKAIGDMGRKLFGRVKPPSVDVLAPGDPGYDAISNAPDIAHPALPAPRPAPGGGSGVNSAPQLAAPQPQLTSSRSASQVVPRSPPQLAAPASGAATTPAPAPPAPAPAPVPPSDAHTPSAVQATQPSASAHSRAPSNVMATIRANSDTTPLGCPSCANNIVRLDGFLGDKSIGLGDSKGGAQSFARSPAPYTKVYKRIRFWQFYEQTPENEKPYLLPHTRDLRDVIAQRAMEFNNYLREHPELEPIIPEFRPVVRDGRIVPGLIEVDRVHGLSIDDLIANGNDDVLGNALTDAHRYLAIARNWSGVDPAALFPHIQNNVLVGLDANMDPETGVFLPNVNNMLFRPDGHLAWWFDAGVIQVDQDPAGALAARDLPMVWSPRGTMPAPDHFAADPDFLQTLMNEAQAAGPSPQMGFGGLDLHALIREGAVDELVGYGVQPFVLEDAQELHAQLVAEGHSEDAASLWGISDRGGLIEPLRFRDPSGAVTGDNFNSVTTTLDDGRLDQAAAALRDSNAVDRVRALGGHKPSPAIVELRNNLAARLERVVDAAPPSSGCPTCTAASDGPSGAVTAGHASESGLAPALPSESSAPPAAPSPATTLERVPATTAQGKFAGRILHETVDPEYGIEGLHIEGAPDYDGILNYRAGQIATGEKVVILDFVAGIKGEPGAGAALQQALLERYPDSVVLATLSSTNRARLLELILSDPFGAPPSLEAVQQRVPIMRQSGYDYTVEAKAPSSPDFPATIQFKAVPNPDGNTSFTMSPETHNVLFADGLLHPPTDTTWPP